MDRQYQFCTIYDISNNNVIDHKINYVSVVGTFTVIQTHNGDDVNHVALLIRRLKEDKTLPNYLPDTTLHQYIFPGYVIDVKSIGDVSIAKIKFNFQTQVLNAELETMQKMISDWIITELFVWENITTIIVRCELLPL